MTQNKSTGPLTAAGKATSSQNALRHGLASGTILIPGEDPEEFAALQDGLLDQYQPADLTEKILVNDMARHHWLKDRAMRLQGEALAIAQPGELPPTFSVLLRYQTTNERAFHKALTTLQALRKQQVTDNKQQNRFVSQQKKQSENDLNAAINAYIYGPLPGASGQPSAEEMMRLTLQNDPGELPEDLEL